jgi:hypothetical protein
MLAAVVPNPNRVLLFAMPPLLHDIFDRLLSDVPGVQLIAGARDATLSGAAIAARADVVIAEESAASADEVCALLQHRPRTRALAVSHDGRTGVLYELRPQRFPIGDLSLDVVLAGIAPRASCQQLLREPSPRPTP